MSFRPDWIFALAALLILAAALWARPARDWAAALRLAAYGLILWLVLEPTGSAPFPASGKPALAVLVDVSRSMAIRDPEQRLEKVRALLQRCDEAWKGRFDLSYFKFSSNAARSSLKELLKAEAQGARTDIAGGIEEVARELRKDRPAVIVFSDGTQTAQAEGGMDRPAPSDGTPVFAVGVGGTRGLLDLSLQDLRGSDFAFKNRPVEVRAAVRNYGFAGRTVPVLLREKRGGGWVDIAAREAVLGAEARDSEVAFRFVPQSPGVHEYRLEVPVQEGEMARENNALDFSLEVGREKIRVLYLCGQPGPEYAFLRQVLKSDPSIELVSFVILRNPENVIPVPEEQLSLIPFPTHDIFVTTLAEFDLLIFENFSYARFGILPAHLDNIQRFVEEKGGGFVMIGGENSFGRGGYEGTGVDRILPVRVSGSDETMAEDPFSIRVLEPQHPIFDVAESLLENQRAWKNMPRLSGYHRLPGLKSGATLLAVAQESGLPIAAAWQRRNGRVLALASLSTWQWALGLAERGFLQSGYTQFWRQSIRWLTSSAGGKPIKIVLQGSQFTVGKEVPIKLIVQSDAVKSARGLEVELNAQARSGAAEPLPLTASGKFEYRSQWTPRSEGDAVLSAVLKDGSRKYEDRRALSVRQVDLEYETPFPDHDYLKRLARSSGGDYYDIDAFRPDLLNEKIKPQAKPQPEAAPQALWLNPWVFSILILILIAEWAWRRLQGQV